MSAHLLSLLFCLLLTTLQAADTATATVTFKVSSVNAISVSGNPPTLEVKTANAGEAPASVTDSTTTYNITTNASNQKITASIDAAMPNAVTLSISLAAPSGATSAGFVAMSTTAANLVTAISNVAQSNLTITYKLAATVGASVAGPLTRTVTYTIGP